MEKVDNYHRNRKPPFFIFPGDIEKLILGPVAQLALPKTHAIFRHHGNGSCRLSIGFFNFSRAVPRGNPVIQLFGRLGFPNGNVFSKGDLPYGGIVPEKTITQIRKHKRDRGLGIPLRQFQRTAFKVKPRLLVLAHSVNFLIRRNRFQS